MARSTPDPTEPSTEPFRVAGLDGLRAIAVIAVVLFHVFPAAMPGGFLGVDLFFVVSGFIITALLLRERAAAGRIDLRGFWLRRARRLLPALLALLLVCTALAAAIGGDPLLGIGPQLAGALSFSANWVLLGLGGDYFAETAPELFRHLWSLGVEEQFYLMWPLALLLLLRMPRRLRIVLIAALALASAVAMGLLWDPALPTRVYYGTDTHAFGLALGALLAVVAERWPTRRLEWPRGAAIAVTGLGTASVLGLVALAVLLPAGSWLVFRGGLQLVAVLTALAIAGLLLPASPIARVLDATPLRWVGQRSYAMYLWHWPLLVLLTAAFPASPRTGVEALPLGLAVIALTTAASAASYRLLEQPMRRDGVRATLRRWRGTRPLRRAAAGLAAVALLAGAGVAAGTAISRDPGVGEAEAAILAGIEALERLEPPPESAPVIGSPIAPPAAQPAAGDRIIAIGDSVTVAATPELRERFPGIRIDAAVSRQLSEAPAIIERMVQREQLRDVVVLALGTNGPIESRDLERIRSLIGPDRLLVLVNAQAPRGWIPGVNRQLSRFAQAYREVELANWHSAIQPHLDVLAPDQVHFAGAGARIFARTLEDALQRLAELPPLRDDRADLSYPAPG